MVLPAKIIIGYAGTLLLCMRHALLQQHDSGLLLANNSVGFIMPWQCWIAVIMGVWSPEPPAPGRLAVCIMCQSSLTCDALLHHQENSAELCRLH
jgi:hypothetical protein